MTPSENNPAPRARWPFVSLLPLGVGAWVPIYAGSRAQRRSWVLWGILWTLITIAGWALSIDNPNGPGGFCIIVGWVGVAATSFLVRGDYERQMGSPLLTAQEAGQQRLRDRAHAQELARTNPALAQEMGIGRPDRPGAADAGLVDVNNASVTALLKLPGMTGDVATEIVEAREKVHGFDSLEDMGSALDLDGDLVEGLTGEVVFLPRPGTA
jgi:hypothetical protein